MTTATSSGSRRSFVVACGLGLTAASVVLRGGFDVAEVAWLPLALMIVAAIEVRRLEARDRWFTASLVLFAGVWLARGAQAGTSGRALSLSAFAVAFGSTYVLARRCDEVERAAALRWLTIVAAGVSILSLVGFVRHVEPWALSFDGTWRLAGPFAYPNAAGLFCGLGVVALLEADRRPPLERVGLGVPITAALIATMSRGAALITAIGLAGRARRGAYLVVGGVVAAIVALALIVNNASVDDRVAEWGAALRQFRSHLLIGVGPERDLLIHNFRGDAVARYAHNEFLQVAAGAGLIGLAALGFVVVSAVRVRRGQVVLAMIAIGALIDFNWHFLGLATTAGWLAGLDVPAIGKPPRILRSADRSPSSYPADPTAV